MILTKYLTLAALCQGLLSLGLSGETNNPSVEVKDRLIKLSANAPAVLMSQSEMFELLRQDINFFDITGVESLHDVNSRLAPTENPPVPTALTNGGQVKRVQRHLTKDGMESFLTRFVKYHTRYYQTNTGKQASNFVYNNAALAHIYNLRANYNVIEFKHEGWNQTSIIARIEGSDPKLKNEIVVVGAHLDSVNSKDPLNGRSPGADDDGSGVATVLEVLKATLKSGLRFKRTVEFQFYSAEEVGLKGSQAIANRYKAENKKVAGMLQLDMTGFLTPQRKFKIITDFTDPELTAFLRLLVPAYSSLPQFDLPCGYACSDHASWFTAGFRSSRAAEAERNFRLHTVNDTMEFVDFENALEFAKLATGFVVELAQPLTY